ncbi:MAG TPA: helix-turn-helix domain-containing protein [Stellaceae bacterium]|jgi:AcrR family transcriptional regulator|nr:helix-turn-helix domain-containing protein [Stellaceae bacterium]
MEQARSAARKREILRAARALLIEDGLQGMTLAKVARQSRSATGSILHFYKTKETLVESVAEEVIDAIVGDAAAALRGYDAEVEPAVRSLLTACSKWPQRFPHYRRLAGYVEPDRRGANGPPARGLQARLERVLADWARRLITLGRVVPLSSAQLYAILIAPALCETADAVVPAPGKQEMEWIDFLVSAALKAIVPQTNGGGAPKRKAGSVAEVRPKGQNDLFDRRPP